MVLVFPKMLSQTNSIDLNTRHGNILGCAEVVHALHLWAGQSGRYCKLNNTTRCIYFPISFSSHLFRAREINVQLSPVCFRVFSDEFISVGR